jgi:DNA-binding MarR family transcriptional regulator
MPESGPGSTQSANTQSANTEPANTEPANTEPANTEPGSVPRQQLEGEFVLAMRQTGSITQLLSQAAAERIGINTTDLNCLNVIALTGSMTAGELARATGLTTASITGVLDRLEDSGFVRRERDPGDRRRVNVVLNAGRALTDVAPVFAPMLKAWRTVASRYSDDELRQFVEFQQQVAQIMRDQLTRLRAN